MTKRSEDVVLDAAMDKVATGIILRVCSSAPADRAAAIAATLASVALTAGDGNGDFTVANGDTSGRKVTVSAQSAVPVTVSGTANHLAIDDGASQLIVTEAASAVAVTSGGTVDVSAFDYEIQDPT